MFDDDAHVHGSQPDDGACLYKQQEQKATCPYLTKKGEDDISQAARDGVSVPT